MTAREDTTLGGLTQVALDRSGDVEDMLAVVKELLAMDVAYVAEFQDGHQVVRSLEGNGASFALAEGSSRPLAGTYCQRMVDGRLGNLVTDARHDPEVRDLEVTTEADIGSYVGVPLRFSDGSVRGSLCCLSHAAETRLGERDVRFMHVLARLVADRIEQQALEAANRRLQVANHRLELEATGVGALLAALGARDGYTARHSEAVVELATRVGEELGLSEDELLEVGRVALLHDIGKIGVPDAVLQKPGPLDPAERDLMRTHPVIGARMVAAIDSLAHLAPAVRAEHERWDGKGYPDGLEGEEIPLSSRIVFACDAFHAMSSDRPYRKALSADEALEEMRRCRGRQFCPRTVDALLTVLPHVYSGLDGSWRWDPSPLPSPA